MLQRVLRAIAKIRQLMILIGHPHIPSEIFRHIASLSDLEQHLRLSEGDEAHTERGRVFWFGASEDREFALSRFCSSNNIDFAVMIGSLRECILSSQYAPKYLIVDFRVADFSLSNVENHAKNSAKNRVRSPNDLGLQDLAEASGKNMSVKDFGLQNPQDNLSHNLAKICQNIADSYLFDSKILAVIQSEQEIESIALSHIDGAIFLDALR